MNLDQEHFSPPKVQFGDGDFIQNIQDVARKHADIDNSTTVAVNDACTELVRVIITLTKAGEVQTEASWFVFVAIKKH